MLELKALSRMRGHQPDRLLLFFFSSRRRHTSSLRDWSSDVCSSDLESTFRRLTRGRAFEPVDPPKGPALSVVMGMLPPTSLGRIEMTAYAGGFWMTLNVT